MGDDEFIPRLGRPGNRGAGAGKRYTARAKQAVKRLAKPKGKKGFSGVRNGCGIAAARMAELRGTPFAKFRMRRVIVKVHIARAAKGIGKAAFRAHVKYIQRDGVDRGDEAEDERVGNLYDGSGERLDDKSFLTRSEEDRHQFRVIVSPEDADQLGDLKETTRAFMTGVERDLGTKLDWVAVDHHNTGHPHTHIVIRGKDDRGADLVIARDYLTRGMRYRAQEIIMDRLGPRRDLEIARANADEVGQERFTGIDRRLEELEQGGVIIDGDSGDTRFERTLRLRRLATLKRLGLATPLSQGAWRMRPAWQDQLRKLGKRGDIIRTLSAHAGREANPTDLAVFDSSKADGLSVVGEVFADMPGDELRDCRALIVAGLDGKIWHVEIGEHVPGALPPAGAVVEVSAARSAPRKSDRTIANISAINGGRYSAVFHAADDPGAQAPYIEAHKRRLEALRRAGVVERGSDSVWHIPRDYLERTANYDAARSKARVEVKSWTNLRSQIDTRAPAWLDEVTFDQCADKGFGVKVTAARDERSAFLKREGLWSEAANGIDPSQRAGLSAKVLQSAAASEAVQSGRLYQRLVQGRHFEGTFEKSVNLATGRFALFARAKEFTLVPWRPELERHRGLQMVVRRTGKGMEWTLGKTRGIGR